MALFGQSQQAWRQTVLAVPPGIPSHDTLGRVFARLHPQRFQACCVAWTQAVAPGTPGALIARDGKTVQAAWARATASAPVPLVCAWGSENGGLVLGHVKTAPTSHESTAMPARLPLWALQGSLVPSDAMGCQTASARQSRDQEGDALCALKRQPTKASQAVKPSCHPHLEPPVAGRTREPCSAACDDAPGRLGRRRVGTRTACAALPALATWPALRPVMGVATLRTAHTGAPTTSHERVSMASLLRSAATFRVMIRQHWPREHTLPWSLDGTFHEDRCRLRKEHAAEKRVAWRHIALPLLRPEHVQSMSLRRKRLRGSLDEHSLLTIISGATYPYSDIYI
jgi:predicted transposase YbfD/YdcC